MSSVAKALLNISSYERRWQDKMAKRFNRIYDDRDQSLADAIRILEGRSSSYFPYVTKLSFGDLPAKENYGLVITGNNFVGDAEKASGSTASNAGQVDFEAVLPGEQTITVTFEDDSGALTITADRSAGTIAITFGDAGGGGTGGDYTAAEVVAAVNADSVARYMVQASVGTAGDIDTDETVSVTTSDDEPGTLPVLHVGSVNVTGSTELSGIHSYSDTEIQFDVDASDFSLAEIHHLRLWVDDVLAFEKTLEMDSWEIHLFFGDPAGTTLPTVLAKDEQTVNGYIGDYANDTAHGEYQLVSDSTSEAQAGQLSGDNLVVDPTKNPVLEAWVKLDMAGATLTADERFVVGLASAHANAEDSLDDVTSNVWFRVEGADLNIYVEGDDDSTDTDDQDSGVDLVDDTYAHFLIDMADLSAVVMKIDGVEQSGGDIDVSDLADTDLLRLDLTFRVTGAFFALAINRLCDDAGIHRPHIVAEALDHRRIKHLKDAGVDEVICAHDFGLGILAQCSINPGLSTVYNSLLTCSDTTNEIYIVGDVPERFCGLTFAEALVVFAQQRERVAERPHLRGQV